MRTLGLSNLEKRRPKGDLIALSSFLRRGSGGGGAELFSLGSVLVSAAAGNKSATRPPLPPPACGGEWKERGRNQWVGIRAV